MSLLWETSPFFAYWESSSMKVSASLGCFLLLLLLLLLLFFFFKYKTINEIASWPDLNTFQDSYAPSWNSRPLTHAFLNFRWFYHLAGSLRRQKERLREKKAARKVIGPGAPGVPILKWGFFGEKNYSMSAYRVICCSHQSDHCIKVCILHKSDRLRSPLYVEPIRSQPWGP